MQFKQNKVGTLLDETNLEVQTKISALDLQRQKFMNQMKHTKTRENETLSKLRDFQAKVKQAKQSTDEDGEWLRNKLKFHIDS